MANDDEHFFHVPNSHLKVFFGEVSVPVFCPFSDVIICFVCVEFEEFFIELGYQTFVCSVICEIFSHFVGCLFVLLTVSFAVQKLLILMKSQKFIFAFASFAFGDMS